MRRKESVVIVPIEDCRLLTHTDPVKASVTLVLFLLLSFDMISTHDTPEERSLVNVSVILLTLFSPDESSLKYEVEFLMNQVWTDPRLRYDDHGRYSYLNALPVRESMWMPDTYFILHGEFKYPTEPVHMALKIFPNGTVLYTSRSVSFSSLESSFSQSFFPYHSFTMRESISLLVSLRLGSQPSIHS